MHALALFAAIVPLMAALLLFAPAKAREMALGESMTTRASFEDTACWFPTKSTSGIRCGYLSVPEDWQDPTARQIQLSVVILPGAAAMADQPPLVFLTGGPGQRIGNRQAEDLAYWDYYREVTSWLAGRELVLMAQRGTDETGSNLFCAPLGDPKVYLGASDTAETVTDASETIGAAYTACAEELQDAGFDLGAYNTPNSAHDYEALRVALGYPAWDVYGISYGTRLAMTMMRHHRDGLRSVVLDSVYPPDLADQLLDLSGFNRALEMLTAACAAEPTCAAAYGDLRTKVADVVARLEDTPVTIAIPDAFQTQVLHVRLTSDLFLSMLYFKLYWANDIPSVPRAIAAAHSKDYETMARLLGTDYVFDEDYEGSAHGLQITLTCNDDAAHLPATFYDDQMRDYPLTAPLTRKSVALSPCATWPYEAVDPVEKTPVVSDVPVLLLAGKWDPTTPPAYAEASARTLSNSHTVYAPAVAHGVSGSSQCADDIIAAFYRDPTATPQDCLDPNAALDFSVKDPGTEPETPMPADADPDATKGITTEIDYDLSPATPR